MKPTAKQLAQWANEQRRLYRAGRLEKWKVKALLATPGWNWKYQKVAA